MYHHHMQTIDQFRKQISTSIGVLVASAFLFSTSAIPATAADPWPTTTSATEIASGLSVFTSDFEASGIDYVESYGYVSVGDDGDIAMLDGAGSVTSYDFFGGDIEDITTTHTSVDDNLVYIAHEGNNSIVQYNISTRSFTGNEWVLSDLPVSGGFGFEAIAYVPEELAPASWGAATDGGFFLAASQAEANIYIYTFDQSTSGTVNSIHTMPVSYTDVSALHFNMQTHLLYVVFDTDGRLKEYALDGTIVNSYYLPTGGSEEGVVVRPDCDAGIATILITNDATPNSISSYAGYPISCVDADADMILTADDCDDTDSGVGLTYAYFEDRDGDGLGNPSVSIDTCESVAPAGYTTDDSDTNDAIPNAGIEIKDDYIDNDGDGRIDEFNTLAENGAHPYYGNLPRKTPSFRHVQSVTLFMDTVAVRYLDNSAYLYTVFSSDARIGMTTVTYSPWLATVVVERLRTVKKMNVYTGVVY